MKFQKPNLFIIGAPKCGTTSLANYLNQHSNVGMCKKKEPFYFADEFKELHKVSNIKEYLELYDSDILNKDIVFEGSTHYLMSFKAVDNILKFNPNARFICMVRNPFDLIPSWHDELVYQGHQNLDFDEALKKAEKMNKNIDKQRGYADRNMMYDYLYVASNGKHIERLSTKIETEQIKFIIFDEFVSNTEKVFDSVCAFLNVEKENIDFKKVNARKYHKYPRILHYWRKFGKIIRKAGIRNTGLGTKIIGLQLEHKKKVRKINYSEYIIEQLNNDIQLLQKQLKVDLRMWLKN